MVHGVFGCGGQEEQFTDAGLVGCNERYLYVDVTNVGFNLVPKYRESGFYFVEGYIVVTIIQV